MVPRSRRTASSPRDGGRREASGRRDPGNRGAAKERRGSYGRRQRSGGSSNIRRLPPEILQRIKDDPLFQVTTIDGGIWIDPYSGTGVPADQGYAAAARDYLTDHPLWRDHQPMGMDQLLCVRWRHDLMRLLPHEPRLRIFGRNGTGWVNPYSGALHSEVTREEGKITARTIAAMSEVLARSDEARAGVMLEHEALQKRVEDLGSGEVRRSPSGSESVFGLQMEQDLNRAKDVQANMLADLPELEGYDLAVHFAPHSGVSGDFYEVLKLPDGRLLLVLGDVSGHGVQAALVVATALKTLRLLARQVCALPDLISRLNDEIKDDLLPGQFITLFAAIFDPLQASMDIVLAGHHPVVIANPDEPVILRKVGRKGMAVGLIAGELFRRSLQREKVELKPGDVALQFTDGLFEAIDANDEEYGEARLYGQLMIHCQGPMEDLVQALANDVVEFAGGNPDDDLTLFGLARLSDERDSGVYDPA